MNWFKRLLTSKSRFCNGQFSLRLVPVFRECLRIQYKRGETLHDLTAEYVGRRWGALDIRIPSALESQNITTLVRDLQVGLNAMDREYVLILKKRENKRSTDCARWDLTPKSFPTTE